MHKKKTVRKIPVQCFVISFLDRLSLGAINNKFVCSSPKYVWIFYTKMMYQLALMQNLCFLLLLMQILFDISIK